MFWLINQLILEQYRDIICINVIFLHIDYELYFISNKSYKSWTNIHTIYRCAIVERRDFRYRTALNKRSCSGSSRYLNIRAIHRINEQIARLQVAARRTDRCRCGDFIVTGCTASKISILSRCNREYALWNAILYYNQKTFLG